MDIYQHIYGHPESCSTLLPPHTNEQRDGHLCKWSGTEIQMNLKRAQPCYSIWMNDYALAILSYSPRQFVQRSINNINNIWSTPPDRQRRSSLSICSPTSAYWNTFPQYVLPDTFPLWTDEFILGAFVGSLLWSIFIKSSFPRVFFSYLHVQ